MRDGWRLGLLGDLIEEVKGAPVPDPWNHQLATVRLYARGIQAAGRNPNQTKRGRAHYFRRSGEILVGRQNFHHQCVGVVPIELDGYVTSNAISAFKASDGADPSFAYLVMAAGDTAKAADDLMPGTGQREISVKKLLSIPVVIPPLAEQRRIVDLIDALDDAIEAVEVEALELDRVISRLRIVRTEAPVKPLGELLLAIDSGMSVASSANETTGLKMLRISAVQHGRFDLAEFKYVGDAELPERARLYEGDLLMTRSNTPDRVGYVSIAEGVDSDYFFPDLVWRLVPKRDVVDTRYLMDILSSDYGRSEIMARASGTSASMQKVSKARIATVPVPVPSLEEQSAYVAPIQSAQGALRAARAHAEALRALRSNLLTVLLSGEHEIPLSYDEFLTRNEGVAA